MSVLSYQSIKQRCMVDDLLSPWFAQRASSPFYFDGHPITLTGGLGPCGYDIHLAEALAVEPDGSYMLASSAELFNMPHDLVARVCDKSTWARRGLFVQNTVIEPGWRGHLTLEITYHGKRMEYVPPGTPIAQVLFETLDEPTDLPYEGKYQDQSRGPQEAR